MKRFLPYPLLSLFLFVMWLLLTGSLAPRSIIFAMLMGIAVPFVLTTLEPEKPRIGNPRAILRLAGIVLHDIVQSNIAVAKIIFGRHNRKPVSGFIYIPLEMRNSYGLAVLAIIITSTPGTLWIQYDRVRGRLMLHVLDLIDEDEWIRLIKNRYESLLMEIFE